MLVVLWVGKGMGQTPDLTGFIIGGNCWRAGDQISLQGNNLDHVLKLYFAGTTIDLLSNGVGYYDSNDDEIKFTVPNYNSGANCQDLSGDLKYYYYDYSGNYVSSTSSLRAQYFCGAKPTISPASGGTIGYCRALNLTASYSAGTGGTFVWSNGATGSVFSTTSPGTYSVTYYASNTCSVGVSTPVTVTSNIIAPQINISPSGFICSTGGGSVTLTATINSNNSYLGFSWYNSSGTQLFGSPLTNASSTLVVSTPDVYTVHVSFPGCTTLTQSYTLSPVIAPTPPSISPGGPTTFCTGGSVSLTCSAGDKYLWSSGETTQNITASTSGNYSVQIISNNGCTSLASTPVTVTVNPIPGIPTVSPANPPVVCGGTTITLTASTSDGYLWSTGETTQSITTGNAGNYSVQAISNGCTSAASQAVAVTTNTPPVPTITASGSICNQTGSGSITFTAHSAVTTNFIWSDNSTASTLNSQNLGTTYTVRAIFQGCTSQPSDPVTVTATFTPTPAVRVLNNVVCSNNEISLATVDANIPGATYFWRYEKCRVLPGDHIVIDSYTDLTSSNLWHINLPLPLPTLTGEQRLFVKVYYVLNGCTSLWATSIEVPINQSPVAGCQQLAQNPISTCDNYYPVLTTDPNNPKDWTYQWTYDGPAHIGPGVISTAPTCSTQGEGNYIVVAISPAGCISDPEVIKVIYNYGAFTWTGASNQRTWFNARNWQPNGIPGPCDEVIIPTTNNTHFYPVIEYNESAGCNDLILKDAGYSHLTNNGILGLYGGITVGSTDGITIQNSGTIESNGVISFRGNYTQIVTGDGDFSTDVLELQATDPALQVSLGQSGAGDNPTVNVTGGVVLKLGTLFTDVNSNGTSTLVLKSTAAKTAIINDFGSEPSGFTAGVQYYGSIDPNSQIRIERFIPPCNNCNINSGIHLISSPFHDNVLPIFDAATGIDLCSFLSEHNSSQTGFPNAGSVNCNENFGWDGNTGMNCYMFNSSGSWTYYQDGYVNSSPASQTGGSYSNVITVNVPANPLGSTKYSVVGNPYPSPIEWPNVNAINTTNPNSPQPVVLPVAYFYNTDDNSSPINTINPDFLSTWPYGYKIDVGQAFLVEQKQFPITLNFDNNCRTTRIATFYRKAAPDQILRLSLTGETGKDNLLIYGSENGLVDNDRLDAGHLELNLPRPFVSSGSNLAINALPLNFKGNIPLNISVPKAGFYKLAVTELSGVTITLEDKRNGTYIQLESGKELNLLVSEENTGRFILHYGATSSDKVQIFTADKEVTVILPETENAIIEAVTPLGQIIKTVDTATQVTRFTLPTDGLYIIRARYANGQGSVKIMY